MEAATEFEVEAVETEAKRGIAIEAQMEAAMVYSLEQAEADEAAISQWAVEAEEAQMRAAVACSPEQARLAQAELAQSEFSCEQRERDADADGSIVRQRPRAEQLLSAGEVAAQGSFLQQAEQSMNARLEESRGTRVAAAAVWRRWPTTVYRRRTSGKSTGCVTSGR